MIQNYLPMIFKNQTKTQGRVAVAYWDGIDSVFKNQTGYDATGYLNGSAQVSTASNDEGFSHRVENGKDSAKALIEKIKMGQLKIMDLDKPIDVVCHSMGYAHALGAIKVLQDIGLKIGALYCLAPEGVQFTEKNPECMEVLNKIETKVQFGSDEKNDPIFKQDLIAPQYPVPGATRHYHDLNNLDYRNALWQAHMLDPIFKKEFGAGDDNPKDIFTEYYNPQNEM